MDPFTILIGLLGSKAVAYGVLGLVGLLAGMLGIRWIRRSGRKEVQKEVVIEGQDKALRGSEAARQEEKRGADVRDQITGDGPGSPHIKLREPGEDR